MANLQALKAIGRSDTLLKLELIKRPIMIAMLFFAVFISPLAIAGSMCVYGFIAFVVNAFPNRKYIQYSVTEQLFDIAPTFFCSLVMALVVYIVGQIEINVYLCLILQIMLGATLYIAFSRTFNKGSYNYVLSYVKENAFHKQK